MAAYGLTAAGFIRKPLDVILAEMRARAESEHGADVDLSPASFHGIQIGLDADREARMWERLEEVYYSVYPDQANGVDLDRAVAFGGRKRKPARFALANMDITGTPGTLVVDLPVETTGGVRFQLTSGGTIPGGGVLTLPYKAVKDGPAGNVPAGTLTVIPSPQAGVDSVINPDDAVNGAIIETDPGLRQRYFDQGASGGTTIPAMLAALNDDPLISSASIDENTTDATSPEGVPPHSFEVIVQSAAPAAIAQVLHDHRPTSIRAFGAESFGILDSTNIVRVQRWSISTTKDIWVTVSIIKNSEWVEGQEAAVITNVINKIGGTDSTGPEPITYTGLSPGDDVVAFEIAATMHGSSGETFQSLTGIASIEVLIGFAPAPTLSDPLTIFLREEATTTDDKVLVNVT